MFVPNKLTGKNGEVIYADSPMFSSCYDAWLTNKGPWTALQMLDDGDTGEDNDDLIMGL